MEPHPARVSLQYLVARTDSAITIARRTRPAIAKMSFSHAHDIAIMNVIGNARRRAPVRAPVRP